MGAVITASEPSWITPYSGLSPKQFGKLITMLRRGDPPAVCRGRPWSLPLEDRVLLVAAYWRTNLTLRQLAPLFGVSKSAAGRIVSLAHLRAAGLGALADLGFLGLDDDGDDPVVVTGFKATRARRLAPAEKEANRVLAAGRVPVERGIAYLKNWRILTKLRTDPARATHLFRALLVLTNVEATTDN